MTDRTVTTRLRADFAQYVAGMAASAHGTDSVAESARQLKRDVDALERQQRKAAKAVEDIARAEQQAQAKRRAAFEQTAARSRTAGLALLGAFAGAELVTANFDKAMSAVGASTDATGDSLLRLRRAALDAGQATAFSASEAADAENELAKAGVSVRDILGGGLKGALDLAAAGQIEVSEAAEVAATAMTQFRLAGSEVPHLADLLAAGAGKAQGGVHELSYALAQSGLVAAQFGLSIEDEIGTLAAFASAGLLGSDAGTSLKTMLIALANPTDKSTSLMRQLGITAYDVQGRFVGVSALAGQLHDRLQGLTQAQRDQALAQIFGSDAIRAANVLYQQGAQGIEDWIGKVNDQGFAARQAGKQMDNLAGDLEQLRGSLETALIKGGSEATGVLRGMTQWSTNLVNGLSDLPRPLQAAAVGFTGISGAALLLLGGVGTLVPKVREAREALASMGAVGARINRGLGLFGRALGASVPILGAAAVGLEIYASRKAEAARRVEEFAGAIRADSGALGENTRKLVANRLESEGVLGAAQRLGIPLSLVTDAVLGNSAAMGALNSATAGYVDQARRAAYISTYASKGFGAGGQAMSQNSKDALALRDALAGLSPELRHASESAKRQAEAAAASGDRSRGAAGDAKRLAGGMMDVDGAAQEAKDALDQYKSSLDQLNGVSIDLTTQNIEFRNSLAGLGKSLHDNGRMMDLNTQAGRDNTNAFLRSARAAQEFAESTLNATGDQQKANAVLAAARIQLVNVMVQSGLTRAAAKQLVDQYLKIPPSVSTDVRLNADQAIRDLATLNRQLSAFNRGAASIGGRQAAAGGGIVGQLGPRTDPRDNYLIWARKDEAVITPEARARYGLDDRTVLAMNAGQLPSPRYAPHAAIVGPPAPARAEVSGASGGSAAPVVVELTSRDPLLQSLLGLVDARVAAASRTVVAAARAGTGRRRF